jgi:hypothetical protein
VAVRSRAPRSARTRIGCGRLCQVPC